MTALGGRDSDWVSSIFCHLNTSLTMILNPPSDLNIFEILNNTFSMVPSLIPSSCELYFVENLSNHVAVKLTINLELERKVFPLIRLWVITLSDVRLVKFNNISRSSFLLHFNSSAPRKFTLSKHQPSWSLWLKT